MTAAAEIVPAANMAALDTLDPADREVAVTQMLDQARSWLAHSVEATEPVKVQEFRAFVATVAESTKQLRLSKEIQLDATEMIRRAERGVAVAVRKGQEEGTVRMGAGRRPRIGDINTNSNDSTPSVKDIAPDFYNNGMEIGQMGDSFTDEEFEEALTEAKEEGNLSRANVLRKQPGTTAGRDEKWRRVAELATSGHTSHQTAEAVGMTREGVIIGARKRGIEFPADNVTRGRRRIDSDRILSGVTESLSAAAFSLQQIDPLDLDQEAAQEQVDSLTESLTALRRAVRKIKESI